MRLQDFAAESGGKARRHISRKNEFPTADLPKLLHMSSQKLQRHPWTPVQVAYLLMTGGLVVKGSSFRILDPLSVSGLWSLLRAHIHLRCRREVEPKLRPRTGESQTIQNVSKREAVSKITNTNTRSKPSRACRI